MTETELMAIVTGEIDRAKDFTLGTIGKERATAYDYYYGRPFGNEEDGRSKVISHDVAQQIDSALPALIKFFAGSDKAVEFTARKQEDVEVAEQTTELCNYVFYTQNRGFMLLHDAIKNALLQKTGCFKWYWDETTKVEEEVYTGVTEDVMALVSQDKSVEIVEQSPSEEIVIGPDGQPAQAFDIKIKRSNKSGKVKVCVIPADEILVADSAYGMDANELPCVTHHSEKTLSDLVEMGYSLEDVMSLGGDNTEYSMESQARRARTGDYQGKSHEIQDEMSRKVWYDETYIKVDFDGDGVSERRKVCSVAGTMLHNEVIDEVPLSFMTTKMMPHEFFGVSMADEVMDLQLRKSALIRQSMDNLYLANTPRTVVDTTKITNLDDVMTVRMGGIIRSNGDTGGALMPIAVPFVAQHVFPMIEYIDAEEETRTGVSRLMQGIDPNTLNKTATGVNALMNAAQARIELVARGMAETGIAPMFRGVLKTLSEHQEEAKNITFRLRNKYVPVDPRVWDTEYDMTINVGLGTGTKDQQLMHLQALAMDVMAAAQSPYAQVLITPDKLFNLFAKKAELAGFKDATQFMNDPAAMDPQELQQKMQPPPNPEMQKAQMQIEADKQKFQAEQQMEGQKMQADQANEGQKLQQQAALEQFKAQQQMELERVKAEQQKEIEIFKAQLQANVEVEKAKIMAGATVRSASFAAGKDGIDEEAPEVIEKKRSDEERVIRRDQTQEETLRALAQVAQHLARPKRIIRGPDGRAAGVE